MKQKHLLRLFVACLFACPLFSFSQSISGTVIGDEDQSLAGASVTIKGTQLGTIVGTEGEFRFDKVKPGTYLLVFKYLGFETLEREVTVPDFDGDVKVDVEMDPAEIIGGEVLIHGIRAKEDDPIAQTNMDRSDINNFNNGQDFPFVLNMTPSTVVTSDAGAGVGYTGIRVRGSDPTRVNVTLNGIPYNDSESQGTFWVNLPDFASSVENVQVQRGVGSSTNGASAFGASINLMTDDATVKPFADITNGYGSFNTRRHTIRAGTGLIDNKFSLNARLSKIGSDGYIDRGWSDLKSFFVSGSWYGGNSMLKAVVFSGKERTYQAWYGVPEDSLETNRTYNSQTYENEIDNYQQDHYQLHFSHDFGRRLKFHSALHYTRGMGYFEQFVGGEILLDYGLDTVFTGNDTITNSDIIRRRWLDNDFYGLTWDLTYNPNEKWDVVFGGAANRYTGRHFGEVIWAEYASNGDIRHIYYDNDATKDDVNAYLKANWRPHTRWNIYADLQVRNVSYDFQGFDDSLQAAPQSVSFTFFNPKFGFNYRLNSANRIYASFAVGNKEPSRNDFVESSPATRPVHETLYDIEIGYERRSQNYKFLANLYNMIYNNQLVLVGNVNDVGAYTRTNIKNSFRRGIEIVLEYNIHEKISIGANATLSQNKVKDYIEIIDDFDDFVNDSITYASADISFSPNVISAAVLSVRPVKGLDIRLQSKYVGKQFLDNTSNDNRAIDAFFTTDLVATYSWTPKWIREIRLQLWVNNIFNETYESNGYTYGYIWGGEQRFNFLYPQAGTNFMTALTLGF